MDKVEEGMDNHNIDINFYYKWIHKEVAFEKKQDDSNLQRIVDAKKAAREKE